MSLYKQPGSKYWWIQIWTKDGKRIRKSTETDDRAKAEVVEKTFRMAVRREAPAQRLIATLQALYGVEAQSLGVDQVWPVYLEWVKAAGKELVKTTLDKRALAIHRFIDWATDEYPAAMHVAAVDRAAATAFAAYLARQGMKGKTRQNIIGDLSTVWEALKRARDGITNPWPLVRPEANDSERGHAFTREQEIAVMKAAKKQGNEWPLACLISRYTGLRYSSIGRLAWADVDLKRALINHTPNKTKRHGIHVLAPLVEPLLSALKAARAEDPDGQYVLPIHARVYPRTHASNGPGLFSKILEAAKVTGDGYTFHSWRHTFRTRLSEAGVSDDLAKRLGGWTEDATAARYDHAERIAELRAAVEKAK